MADDANKTTNPVEPTDTPVNSPDRLPQNTPAKVKKTIELTPKQKKLVTIGSAILLVILVIAGATTAALRRDKAGVETVTQTTSTPAPTPTPTTSESMLDGVVVANELARRHPLAIMVENHPEARPQTGLTDASLVYEAIAEGGITRFMAVYGHKVPEKVGPARSARDVYVDFAEEFQPNSAYYAHVGGSAPALNKIKMDKVFDLDQMTIGTKAFKRYPKAGVATEHTMYAFPDKLFEIAKDRGYSQESTFKTWKFKDDASVESRPETQTITVPFSSITYEVKWEYDKLRNSYKRSLAGSPHKDAESGQQIEAKNVIVQSVSYAPHPDAPKGKGLQHVKVHGTGTAKIFRDGKMIEAKWEKEHSPTRTIYRDAATGEEIEFNRGQTWIQLQPSDKSVTVQ